MIKNTVNKKAKSQVVAVSGGFDPVHVGHVRMVNEQKIQNNNIFVCSFNYIFNIFAL